MGQGMRYLLLANITLLIGCSPINSVQPFDQKQAAILISEHLKPQTYSKFNTYRASVQK